MDGFEYSILPIPESISINSYDSSGVSGQQASSFRLGGLWQRGGTERWDTVPGVLAVYSCKIPIKCHMKEIVKNRTSSILTITICSMSCKNPVVKLEIFKLRQIHLRLFKEGLHYN